MNLLGFTRSFPQIPRLLEWGRGGATGPLNRAKKSLTEKARLYSMAMIITMAVVILWQATTQTRRWKPSSGGL